MSRNTNGEGSAQRKDGRWCAAAYLPVVTGGRRPREPLSAEEARKLLAATRGHRLGALWALLITLGQRRTMSTSPPNAPRSTISTRSSRTESVAITSCYQRPKRDHEQRSCAPAT
jgi:hypothetical protein